MQNTNYHLGEETLLNEHLNLLLKIIGTLVVID